jgi:hypothetical protein
MIKGNTMNKTLLAICLFVALPMLAMAADEGELQPLPGSPKLPPQVQSGKVLEPEVTIRETDKGTVHKYSVNGQVYMVKVVPEAGPPYYFIDSDGDGELDARVNDIHNISVPQWVLFSW